MIVSRIVLSAALCALLAGSASATAPATLPVTKVDLGSAPFYVQNDTTSALAGVQVLLRAGLDRQSAAQSGLAALAAETIARTPIDGVPLAELVAARGGTFSSSVGPQYVRFYLQAEPATLIALAPLVARAIAQPDTSLAVVNAARAVVAAHSADDESNPVSVGLAMVRQSFYDNGASLPVYGTTGTLANLTGADVRAYMAAHYVRGNAIVSAAGDVTHAQMHAFHARREHEDLEQGTGQGQLAQLLTLDLEGQIGLLLPGGIGRECIGAHRGVQPAPVFGACDGVSHTRHHRPPATSVPSNSARETRTTAKNAVRLPARAMRRS